MLVLSRKPNEEIVIGDDIRLKVLKVNGGKVVLGLEAPDHVRILRCEIQEPRQSVCLKESNDQPTPQRTRAAKMFQQS